MLTQAPRGTKDVLPADSYRWQYVESKMCQAAAEAGFREVRTPVFEHTELFLRGVGDTTDIVQKEMYTSRTRATAPYAQTRRHGGRGALPAGE